MPCVKGCLKSWAVCYTLAPVKPTSSNGILVRLKIRHHEWEKGAKNGLANLNNRMNQENITLFGDESELIITYPHMFHQTHLWNYVCFGEAPSLSDMGNIPQTLRTDIFVVLTAGHGSLQIRRVGCCFCPKGRHNPSLKLDFSSINVVIYFYICIYIYICQGMLNWDKIFPLFFLICRKTSKKCCLDLLSGIDDGEMICLTRR